MCFTAFHKEQTARRGWILKAYRLEFNKENPPRWRSTTGMQELFCYYILLCLLFFSKKKKKRKWKRKGIVRDAIESQKSFAKPLRWRETRFPVESLKSESNSRKFLHDDSHQLKFRNLKAYGKFKLFFWSALYIFFSRVLKWDQEEGKIKKFEEKERCKGKKM